MTTNRLLAVGIGMASLAFTVHELLDHNIDGIFLHAVIGTLCAAVGWIIRPIFKKEGK